MDENIQHKQKMQKRKQLQSEILATKTEEKGLLIVYTGSGKGKSTAAFGTMFRMVGYGRKVGVVQFIKAPEWQTGERKAAEAFSGLVEWHTMGEGFTWDTQDRQRDIDSCRKAWDKAKELLKRDDLSLVILDELNIALRYGYLPLEEVLQVLGQRPAMQHVIITGRNAKATLIEAADLVTEMTLIKHPFDAGIKAQKGIEY